MTNEEHHLHGHHEEEAGHVLGLMEYIRHVPHGHLALMAGAEKVYDWGSGHQLVDFHWSFTSQNLMIWNWKFLDLKQSKKLLAPGNDDADTSDFDDLIDLAKEMKEKIEALKNEEFEDDDDYSFDEDDTSRFY